MQGAQTSTAVCPPLHAPLCRQACNTQHSVPDALMMATAFFVIPTNAEGETARYFLKPTDGSSSSLPPACKGRTEQGAISIRLCCIRQPGPYETGAIPRPVCACCCWCKAEQRRTLLPLAAQPPALALPAACSSHRTEGQFSPPLPQLAGPTPPFSGTRTAPAETRWERTAPAQEGGWEGEAI